MSKVRLLLHKIGVHHWELINVHIGFMIGCGHYKCKICGKEDMEIL